LFYKHLKRPNIAELIYIGSVLKLLIFEEDEIYSMTVYYCRAVETLYKGPDAEAWKHWGLNTGCSTNMV